MGWFSRETAPTWSGFASMRVHRRFERKLLKRLDENGVAGRIENTQLHARNPDYDGMGLENLARLCAGVAEKHWPAIINGHLETIVQGKREARELESYIGDFSRAGKILKARVWPEHYLRTAGAENLVFRVDVPGTITCLCFDLPSTLVNVGPGHARAWKKKKAELFTQAFANVHRENKIQVVENRFDEIGLVYSISGNHYFVPSHAPSLLERKKYTGRTGTLLAMPTRESLLLYPVRGKGVIEAMSLLIPGIARAAAHNPGFVSDKLYWHHAGKFHVVDYELQGDALDIQPSPAVARLLKKYEE